MTSPQWYESVLDVGDRYCVHCAAHEAHKDHDADCPVGHAEQLRAALDEIHAEAEQWTERPTDPFARIARCAATVLRGDR